MQVLFHKSEITTLQVPIHRTTIHVMEAKGKYAVADIDAKLRKRVARIAKREKLGKAVMAGKLIERGLAEYERTLAEGKGK